MFLVPWIIKFKIGNFKSKFNYWVGPCGARVGVSIINYDIWEIKLKFSLLVVLYWVGVVRCAFWFSLMSIVLDRCGALYLLARFNSISAVLDRCGML